MSSHKIIKSARAEYWDLLRKDAERVAQLPHSIRGGRAALENEEELRQLDETIAGLKSRLQDAQR